MFSSCKDGTATYAAGDSSLSPSLSESLLACLGFSKREWTHFSLSQVVSHTIGWAARARLQNPVRDSSD